ncbi:hypothetical protein [Sphingomonas baiyangensis]|uniref:Uncharacterized protein n=1 Tax=Sphingomonas baiyangensis TaxID=2572576 RepID=A0A4U1L1B6_9SPHN|nr:hypothetical protein [Sphingomonas baiyangensis]TKD50589.1 hypothetical protein FBR43_07280 [Sphingomonas baiyangensis]
MKLFREVVQDRFGNVRALVPVEIRLAGTTTKATLYATDDVGGDVLVNPQATDNNGYLEAYIADGTFDLVVAPGQPGSYTIPDVQHADLIGLRSAVLADYEVAAANAADSVAGNLQPIVGEAQAGAAQAQAWATSAGAPDPATPTIKSARGYAIEADAKSQAAGVSAAVALTAAGPNYANAAAGLAATSVGQSFAVFDGINTVTIYRHDAGPVATVLRRYPFDLVPRLADQDRRIAATISPTVAALRLGWEGTAGAATAEAKITSFQQPIAHATAVTERWRGMVRTAGLHFHAPYDATTMLIDNPDTGQSWQVDFGLELSGTQKFRQLVVTDSGLIICIPYSATWFLVIDPRTMVDGDPRTIKGWRETFGLPAAALSGAGKYDGGTLIGDTLVCAPFNATSVPFIDVKNMTGRVLTATQLGLTSTALNGSAKYSDVVSIGSKAYCVAFGAANFLVIDVPTETATQPTFGLTLSDANKFSSAIVVGKLIYLCPFTSADVGVLDTVAGTGSRTAMGASLTGNNKWRKIVRVSRKLVCVPGDANDFLEIDLDNTSGSTFGTATRKAYSIYDVRVPGTTGTLPNGTKWSGALAYGDVIHGCPCGTTQAGQDILLLDMAANAGAGQAMHTDRRVFLPTGVTGSTKWFGANGHPNGWNYCWPASATDFLIFRDDDPDNDFPVAVRHNLGLTLTDGDQKFQGGFLTGDLKLGSFPRSQETRMCFIDPADKTASPYGTAILTDFGGATDLDTGATGVPLGTGAVDEQKWHSSDVGMDGCAYGIPYNAEKVIIYDYRNPDASKIMLTNFGLDLSGIDKWVGTVLYPNGWLVCAPRSHSKILIIDTNPQSPTYRQAWLVDCGKDINALSLAGQTTLKYSFPQIGADGRIYFMPRTARNVMVLDPSDTSEHPFGKLTFETGGLDMTPLGTLAGSGYTIAAKTGPDGVILAAAVGGTLAGVGHFLFINTMTGVWRWSDLGLQSQLNASNKVAGCMHTLAGKLIFIPRSANFAIQVKLKGVPPLPAAAVLGPYLNKC